MTITNIPSILNGIESYKNASYESIPHFEFVQDSTNNPNRIVEWTHKSHMCIEDLIKDINNDSAFATIPAWPSEGKRFVRKQRLYDGANDFSIYQTLLGQFYAVAYSVKDLSQGKLSIIFYEKTDILALQGRLTKKCHEYFRRGVSHVANI
jgi:hypothetical protein